MTKKVLISLEDIKNITDKDLTGSPHYCADYDYIEDGVKAASNSICKDMEEWFNYQPEAPQWVSVEDGLPDNNDSVIIFIVEKFFGDSGNISVWQSFKIGIYHEKEKNWSIQDYSPKGDVNKITHWMPIPGLPEKDDTKE